MSNKTKPKTPKPRKAPLSRVMWANPIELKTEDSLWLTKNRDTRPVAQTIERVTIIRHSDIEALVERAAKAIYKDANCSDWSEQSKAVKDSARSLARAALTSAGIPCAKPTKQRRARK